MFGLSILQISAISGLVLLGASAGSYEFGYQKGHYIALIDAEKAKTAAVVKAAAEARALGIAEGQITITAGQHFADVQTKIVTRTITQIKEVPIYVTQKADASCVIPIGFVQLHDRAATPAPVIPHAPGLTPDDPSGIALSEVAATVAANYGTFHQVRAQLIELQSWIKEQQRLHQ